MLFGNPPQKQKRTVPELGAMRNNVGIARNFNYVFADIPMGGCTY
jgi:hypothetical protein